MSIAALLDHEPVPRYYLGGIDCGPVACFVFSKGQRVKLSADGLRAFGATWRPGGRRYDRSTRATVHGFPWCLCAVSVVIDGCKTPRGYHSDYWVPA